MDKDWIKFQIVPNLRSKNKSTIWLTWSVAVCDCPQSPSPAGSVVLPPVRASASTGRRSRSEKSWGLQLGQSTVRVTVTALTAVLTYLRCRTPLCRPRLLPAGVAVLWPRPSSAQKCVITRKSLFSIHQWEIEMISIDIPPLWPVVGRGGPAPAPPYQRDGRHRAARLGRLGPLLLTGQTVSKSGRFTTFWNFQIKQIFQDDKEKKGLNIE